MASSRRKQPNPKAVKVAEEVDEAEVGGIMEEPLPPSSEHDVLQNQPEPDEIHLTICKDLEEYNEPTRLVIDELLTPPKEDEDHSDDMNTSVTPPSTSDTSLPPQIVPSTAASPISNTAELFEVGYSEELELSQRDGSVSGDGMSVNGSGNAGRDDVGGLSPGEISPGMASVRSAGGSKSRRKTDRILPMPGVDGQENFPCPVCQEVLPSNHDLTKHIRSHNLVTVASTTNTCTICGKILSSQSSLDRHMLVHSGERPFECRVCKMAFTTNGNMHRHMRIHDKEAASSGTVVVDTTSDGQSTGLPQIRSPRVKRHIGNGKSPREENGGGFSKRKMPLVNLINPSAKKTLYQANTSVDDVEDFDDEGNSELPFQRGRIDGDGVRVHCPLCTGKFFTIYGLSCHISSYHSAQPKDQLAFSCSSCRSQFRGLSKLEEHVRVSHSQKDLGFESGGGDVLNDGGDAGRKANCNKSTSTTSLSSSASLHEMLPAIDFSCDKFPLIAQVCGEHSPARRSPKAAFSPGSSCRSCDRSFACSSALDLHTTNLHGSVKRVLVCLSCDMAFETQAQREEHALYCHDSPSVVTQFTQVSDSCDPHDASISTEEFMLVLGMKASPTQTPILDLNLAAPLAAKKTVDIDANQNIVKITPAPPNSDNTTLPMFVRNLLAVPAGQAASAQSILVPAHSMVLSMSNLIHPAFSVVTSQQPLFTASNFKSLYGLTTMAGVPVLAPVLPPSGSSSSLLQQLADVADSLKSESGASSPSLASNSADRIRNDRLTPGSGTVDKDDIQNKSGGATSYNCQYCDEVFGSYRAFRGHMMSMHLGTSPYKCTQCTYASADRSTLIRHLRTHNGERPFQCLICDFAFTTKANCERHVRKKHSRETKESMEGAIGYNRMSKELPDGEANSLLPPATETVCKHCGEDFKFYRTLKLHLRSQSNCCNKPFTCRECSVGFSTKPNCLRHILKQHKLSAGVTAESRMAVNEVMLAAQQHSATASASSSPLPAEILASMKRSFPATSTSVEAVPSKRARLDDSVSRPTFGIVGVKREVIEGSTDDQPLDFSIKSAPMPAAVSCGVINLVAAAKGAAHSVDEPMDLSTGPPRSVTPLRNGPLIPGGVFVNIAPSSSVPFQLVSPKPSSVAVPIAAHQPPPTRFIPGMNAVVASSSAPAARISALQCSQCSVLCKSNAKLKLHMRCHTTAADRSFRCHHCLAMFPLKAKLDVHMKAAHPQFADFTGINNNNNNNSATCPESLNNNINSTDNNTNDCSGNCDDEPNNNVPEAVDANLQTKVERPLIASENLTPVTHILSSANPAQFHALFKSSLISVSQIVPTMLAGLSASIVGQTSPRESPDVVTDLLPESDGDLEPIQTDISDMSDSFYGRGSSRPKRNSYADSPHKLRCPYCPRAFPWISSLKRHILTHTGQKPFRCPQCTVTFSTKSNRERHMIRKHGLDVHDPMTRQMMDRPFKCHLCVFSSFASSGKLARHYRSKHSDHDLPEGLMASIPNMSQEELNWVLSRAALASPGNQDGQLNQTGGDRGDSDDNQDMDNDDYDSDEDDDMSMCDESLEKSAAEAVVEAVIRAVAKVPSGSIGGMSALPDMPASTGGANIRMPKSSPRMNPERDNYNVDRITECWQCRQTFDCRKNLLRHLKEHGVDLPFKCYLCDASFAVRLDSLQHKAAFHAVDWEQLRDKNRVGMDLPDFADYVDRIVEEALGGGTAPATARRVRDGVELDIRMETDYAQRKVFCTLCPKRFWSLQDLRRHMRSHTGERPFECDVCHARFTLKHSMMRHRRKHEGNEADLGDGVSDSEDEGIPADFSNVELCGPISQSEANELPTMASLPDLVQSVPICEATDRDIKMLISLPFSTTLGDQSSAESQSDLLENLLGVSDSQAIDQMLDSADSAAALLGMETRNNESSSPAILGTA